MFKRWFGKEESGDRIAADAIAAYERSHDEFDVIRRLKQALERGLRELPLDRAYTYLGAAYGDVGMHAEAEQAYETALTHNAKNSTALSNLGLSLQRRGEFERCRELFERAIAAKPNNGYAHNNLGALLLHQGACREARPIFERATQFDPTLAVSFANLARCCARLGDFPAAQAAFQQAGRRGYQGLEGLQRELEEARLALPAVYFDKDAFFRLVEQLLPGQTAVHGMLRRAVSEPEELHRELTAAGRMLFMTDYEVSNGLPWLLLCDELERQGLAVRGASRSLEKWVELVLDAVRKRPSRAPLVVAGAISSARRSFADDEEHESEDEDALEAFFNELTRDGTLVLLRLWTSQTQAILCPLERSAWELAAYPSFDGPCGIGRADLLGHAQPRRSIEDLH